MRTLVFPLAALALFATAQPAAAEGPDPDPWIARDKAFHFDVSAGIAAATYAASAAWLVDSRGKALAIGGAVTLAVGGAKELLDLAGVGGDPSWKDFAWDAIGMVAGLAIAWSVDMLLGGVNAEHPALGAAQASSAQSRLVLHF
jgi:putative lipoprotein